MATEPSLGILKAWQEAKEAANSEALNNNRLLSYWSKLFDQFLCSPQEFYQGIEAILKSREVPDLNGGYIQLKEGNMFSRKRLYLQMRRERLVFEICAAPFGTGYFVSSRLFDRRKQATWLDYLIMFVLLIGFMMVSSLLFDLIIMTVLVGFIFTTFWSFMRLAASPTMKWLDEFLFILPCIGPIYESLFHPLTYFREDQNNMYRQVVHEAVMATVDQVTKEVGIKPLSSEERKPTIRELFSKS
jgi:hypothetical protein